MAWIYNTRQSLRLLSVVLGPQHHFPAATGRASRFTSHFIRSSQLTSAKRASSGFSVSFPPDPEAPNEATTGTAIRSTRKLQAGKSPSTKTRAINTDKDKADQEAKELAQLSPDSAGPGEGTDASHDQVSTLLKRPPRAGEDLETSVELRESGSRSDDTRPKSEESGIGISTRQRKPVSDARKARRERNASKIQSRKMDKLRVAAQAPAKLGIGEQMLLNTEDVSLSDTELGVLLRLRHVGGARDEELEGRASEQIVRIRQPKEKAQSGRSVQEKGGKFKPLRKPVAKQEEWAIQKGALTGKFPEGWQPRKKLSPDTIDGIRALHQQYPDKYTTPVLAEQFKVSPEAIRRILKSKWRATGDEMKERRRRWARRYDRIWDQQAAIGLRPPRTKDRKAEVEEFELDQDREARTIAHAHG